MASWLQGVGRAIRNAFKSYPGPYPKIGVAMKQTLASMESLFAKESTPLRMDERILRPEGKSEAIRTMEWKDIVSSPLLLGLGEKSILHYLGIYALEHNGKRMIVVADLSKMVAQKMPGPDLYILEEGRMLKVGRASENDLLLSVQQVRSVSREHLSVHFRKGASQLVIVDISSKGTLPSTLLENKFYKGFSDMIPKKITPSMVGY